jgi:hypothetical protein
VPQGLAAFRPIHKTCRQNATTDRRQNDLKNRLARYPQIKISVIGKKSGRMNATVARQMTPKMLSRKIRSFRARPEITTEFERALQRRGTWRSK